MGRRPNRKRWQAVIAIATAGCIAVTLAGCGGGGGAQASGGKTQITFSYLWTGKEAQAIQKIIADYNASQSKVEVKGVSAPDATKQLASMSGRNGSFDISDNFGSNVGAWASKGVLQPLDSYGIDTSVFVPVTLKQCTYDKKLYSVPIAVHTVQLLYNKKLLAQAGVKPPTTMDELTADIPKLTKQSPDGTITQLAMAYPGTDPSGLFTVLGYAFGGQWDKNGKATPDTPQNVAALDWYTKNFTDRFGAKNISKFISGLGQYMSAEDPFYTGKVAMVIDGEWQSAAIANTAPNLDWGVTAIPAYSPELANTTNVTSSTLFIPTNSKHKKEAADFLKYLISDKGMTAFTLALGNLPSRTDLLDSDAYKNLPNYDVWLKALDSKNAQSQGTYPWSSEYSTDLQSAFDQVIRGVSSGKKAMKSVAAKAKKNYDWE